ncbi:hypothetical protein UPYG_G00009730 [Umbra pygmaea]|uniref:Uncharacterized protein n=1 Tax=Umbra pygmaea TaxID=75934 RepID=A0ABD0Y2H0_UMBPY
MAGVRAALQGAGPPVPSTSLMVSTPGVRMGTSSSATTVTSLRSVPLPSFPWRNGARSGYLNQRNVKTYTKEVRDAVSTTQREHYERQEAVEASAPSDHGTGLQGQRGDNEATIHFADFIPIDVEEDEAIDEAIRRSLLEESVQSLQDSRFAKTLSKEEITGIVKAHSERVVTTNYRPIYIS